MASDLVREVLDGLAERGVPEGTWLIDITEARRELRQAWERNDDLLGRLQDAILTQASNGGGRDAV